MEAALSRTRGLLTLGWGGLCLLIVAAVVIAMGAPLGPTSIVSSVLAVVFAYRYPYATYGLLVALVPCLGLTVSLPTGALTIGERAFGGAIDITVGELVAIALLGAWAIKVILLWIKRRDVNWKPWLPLAIPMGALVGAHLLSVFSTYVTDPLLVVKYALRPVLWCYLIYVVLTVNHVRSRRRLMMTLGVVVATGVVAALMGFISLGISDHSGQIFPRARPLSIFGVLPLGDNHNLLAEWLGVTIPFTLALSLLVSSVRTRRYLMFATFFQIAIALLTFARTIWIVLAFEAIALAWLVWREEVRRWISAILVTIVLLIPFGIAMVAFSSTPLVQSSTSTRLMLTEIALNLWSASPWIGAGAGTFVDRVGSTRVFEIEYGAPLDSHGFIQKLLAETGVVGLAALAWLVWSAVDFVRRKRHDFPAHSNELKVFMILAVASAGALLYQLFNTNYWNGKLWLSLGILLASWRSLVPRAAKQLPALEDE